ncbi:MAG: MBL fold metallo-hydrolase [Prolixibacteraceae bacterium]|jgi:beta-lactamase superfamily II metal-dependent hydrolase|nr:MBL fold metallo-hydrolase [Prolixibacteraceae bacterium]
MTGRLRKRFLEATKIPGWAQEVYLALIFLCFPLISIQGFSQEPGNVLPAWVEGEMEIHHINTGKGESVFCVFPDGTTLLIDAGDAGPRSDAQLSREFPDETGRPGERIARYINKRLPNTAHKAIDYVLLTHFHTDHLGCPTDNSPQTAKGGGYLLSGLTDVGESLKFSKLVDRDWPSYQYPVPQAGLVFNNYRKFIEWKSANEGMQMERFQPGSNRQFVLLHQPEKYKEFEVRNIISNGELWTGNNEETQKLFPEGRKIHENLVSAGIRISYGKFDYFNGGDINGRIALKADPWLDVETPVSQVLGEVEVCEANHHAWIDAMNETFLDNVKPQVIVIQTWHHSHLNLTGLNSMSNKKLNPGLRHIIPTNIPDVTKAYIEEGQVKKLTGNGGHVVIKVDAGGATYRVFLLNDKDEQFTIKSAHGPYGCR